MIHQMWDMREKEESRITPGFGGHARGRMEWPFTDVGKTVAGAGFFVWRLSLILNKFEVPIRCPRGDVE